MKENALLSYRTTKCYARVLLLRVGVGSAAEHFAAYGSNLMSAGFSRGLYS